MTGLPRPNRTVAILAGIGALLATAETASAHTSHDPTQPAAVRSERVFSVPEADPSLPFELFVIATLVLGLVLVLRRIEDRMRLPRLAVTLTVLAALVGTPLGTVDDAVAATILYPDLISDDPQPQGGVVEQVVNGDNRLLLKFDGYVTNVGDGPLEVSGNPQLTDSADPNAMQQRAKDTLGNWHVITSPTVQYELADDHNHFHLMEIGRYSLWNSDKSAEAAPAQKIGFCLYDIEPAEGEDYSGSADPKVYTGTVTQFCDQGSPESTDLVMGTGAGWRDVYGWHLTYQWIDVSNVAPGEYWLANEADPFDRIVETNENNPIGFAKTQSTVPGYNALPVGPVAVSGSTNVTLSIETFGSPGSVEYEIVTAPADGTLDETVGVPFTGATVSYTPDGGASGCDRFEYLARDSTSDFPEHPTRSVVLLDNGGCAGVEVEGLQSTMLTGSSETATAVLGGAASNVTWSVDGVAGGNATVGTITASGTNNEIGLYTAPDDAPGGGTVTIRATRTDNSQFDDLVVTIESANRKPLVVDPGPQSTRLGDPVTFAFGASDPDGDIFDNDAFGLPSGLSINSGTGVVTGTTQQQGRNVVTFVATDSRGLGETLQLEWDVFGEVPVTGSFDFRHPWGLFDDVSWTVDGVAGGSAATGTIVSAGTWNEYGRFTAPPEVPPGGAVTVVATKAFSADTHEFEIRIPGPPDVDPVSDQADTVGDTVALTVSASDNNGDGVSFSATGLPAGLSLESSTGAITGSPVTRGEHSVTLTATDTTGRSRDLLFDWFIAALFADVEPASWYGPSVKWMAETQITTGTTATTFSPHRVLTRAEVVTLLWRWLGSPAPTEPLPFLDVHPSSFAADAIAWAAEVGVVTGTSLTTFNPNGEMNRAQLATVFHRLAGEPAPAGPNPFTDVPAGRYFSVAVVWMFEAGLTNGMTPTLFDPNGTVTRAQTGTVICRYSASAAASAPEALAGTDVCDVA